MNNKTLIGVVVAAAIILLGAVIYALTRPSDTDTTTTDSTETSETTTQQAPTTSPTETDTAQAATITYTDSGFSPSPLTVKTGATITITNNSSSDLSFASADHPTHQKQPELNMDKTLKPGESGTVTITKTGTWGYHNHDMAEHFGRIVVTE